MSSTKATPSLVMLGLDPGIHLAASRGRQEICTSVDYRVKPGNDEEGGNWVLPLKTYH